MAKIDTAKEIVAEFPDKGYEAEKLAEDNTQAELDQLQNDLRAEREAAGDESPTSPSGVPKEASAKKYRLKDPTTSYQEVGFTLADDQEKELPENPSSFLEGYIRSGFIVEV